jgi:hypothetical protein
VETDFPLKTSGPDNRASQEQLLGYGNATLQTLD